MRTSENKKIYREKVEIWLSPRTKTPTHTVKSKKQRDNTKTPPKTSIKQRLRTDLGRLVGVTTATPLVWLNRFTTFPLTATAMQSKGHTFKKL